VERESNKLRGEKKDTSRTREEWEKKDIRVKEGETNFVSQSIGAKKNRRTKSLEKAGRGGVNRVKKIP